ncbi:hypothetical protein ELE36_08875 [Pseudolysobacter antarcticus]|uniref:Uncharacterized protein n=1 Tax=Pseudolysobacter antarcticus TaxID=2511995 RepID=A0A411HJ95_9GAMM|nr:hypothetical protein [Pseudolysobacter antarcticus]QBB70470.1 hypothetical protein ELE36_08875 [Pseudolysobacter antarcticus]
MVLSSAAWRAHHGAHVTKVGLARALSRACFSRAGFSKAGFADWIFAEADSEHGDADHALQKVVK